MAFLDQKGHGNDRSAVEAKSDAAVNIICAYNVNLDAVCNLRAEELSSLLPPDLLSDDIELKGTIASMEDLLSSLLYCMREGSGAEILLDSPQLARRIEASISWSSRLGGNAAIMANLLADLGAMPLLNDSAIGSRLAEMLHPGVRLPLEGALAGRENMGRFGRECDQEPVHFVFQFKRGEVMLFGRERFIVPQDNRFIASYDPINTRLQSSWNFDRYCLENISDFQGALITGFHLLPLPGYREVLREKMDQLISWKKRNADLFIHLELGSFQSPEILSFLLDLIPRFPIDSLGMNEDELAGAAEILGLSSAINPPGSWQERIFAARCLQDKTGIFRVAVHTRDYIFSIIKEGIISAQDELSALNSGVDAAASLAAFGSPRAGPPPQFNEKGLEAAADLCRLGAASPGRGAMLCLGGRIVSLAPARQVSHPQITVGLGDTATASIFLREVEAIKRNAGEL
ncbi:MAG TPA: ADP-dependent glucokinase/phosphofructokinase [Methanothrix sp.]|nr:ADP-dependent glucokinase/phosphofructokinase [Methanothrix sp.]